MSEDALNEIERRALLDALDDEYKAWATYDQVIRDFGPQRPFTNIRDAEMRHIGALLALFEDYGLAVPENPWLGRVPRYTSIRAACEAGNPGRARERRPLRAPAAQHGAPGNPRGVPEPPARLAGASPAGLPALRRAKRRWLGREEKLTAQSEKVGGPTSP